MLEQCSLVGYFQQPIRVLYFNSQSECFISALCSHAKICFWAILGLFFVISFFSNKQYKYNKLMWKCPSSIRSRDSNSQPSDFVSPPLTNRPGLPLKFVMTSTPAVPLPPHCVTSCAQHLHLPTHNNLNFKFWYSTESKIERILKLKNLIKSLAMNSAISSLELKLT